MGSVYLDYNATSPLRACALDAICDASKEALNASAVHRNGRKGRKIVEDARAVLAAGLHVPPSAQIVFNSGATEGNNTVLQYFAAQYPDDTILISSIEHPSVYEVLEERMSYIPVDGDGRVDLERLDAMLSQAGRSVSLVSVMMANNETGVLQPVADIAKLAHKYGAFFHCDATQALGRVPIDMAGSFIDFITISGHKCGGPQGVGALVIGPCGNNPVLLQGGGQEKKLRAGTENVAGIAAFGAAADEAIQNLGAEYDRLSDLRMKLERGILEISPSAIIFGTQAKRLPNTTLFAVSGLKAETLVMAFDLEGVALSNGSACSSGTVKQSHVLSAMGVQDDLGAAALRISMGHGSQRSDVDAFLGVWKKLYERMSLS